MKLPGVLFGKCCCNCGLKLVLDGGTDVSVAFSKFSSSKSPQSSHSFPRSKVTVGIWTHGGPLRKELCSDATFDEAELLVQIWFRGCLEPKPEFTVIHFEESGGKQEKKDRQKNEGKYICTKFYKSAVQG